MSDPDGDAAVLPQSLPNSDDPDFQLYEFRASTWEPPPVPKDIDWFDREERTIRDAHAYAYQQYGTTYHWSKYIHLGYFAVTNCSEFDKLWSKIDTDPKSVHQAIWYNFMYHVEREMPMTEQLNAWALNITHAFLEYHEPDYLSINTMTYSKGVKSVNSGTNGSDATKEQDWIPVHDKKRSNSSNTQGQSELPRKTGGILRSTAQQKS